MLKYDVNHHSFTDKVIDVLKCHFGMHAEDILQASSLLGYLNNKTVAATRGSKARGAFASIYALYVIVEDYIQKGFFDKHEGIPYSKYQGARFSDLFKRQRELPFGAKLQNHALNSRLNEEFKKFYPTAGKTPIVRDVEKQRYWVQEDLLLIKIRNKNGKEHVYNIAKAIIDIIDAYIVAKKSAFESFLETCHQIAELGEKNPEQAIDFITQQLSPNVDARVFEIVSYSILKVKFSHEKIWIGLTKKAVVEKYLSLYKTGRTNANDGGIDFVMKPLGRFFQVTETIDVHKYFLDIDKVQRFPITFVVKSDRSADFIRAEIKKQAIDKYKIESVVETYMKAIEEIINIECLMSAFGCIIKSDRLKEVMDEIVLQSKVEFNYSDEEDDSGQGDDSLL